MTTQKQPGGRRANQAQREFAHDVLLRYKKTGDVKVLTTALEHFSQTGDFSPFSERDQTLQKRAKFLRLQIQVKQLRGKEKDEFISRFAEEKGISPESVRRMLSSKTQTNQTLSGVDRLFDLLELLPKGNPTSSE